MPATYFIDRQRGIVFSIVEGVVTDKDLIEHEECLRHDPDFEPSFNQLVDCRNITQVKVTSEAIWVLAKMLLYSSGSRRATVVNSDLLYGLARMYQILRDNAEEIRVFRDMAEAQRWLGIE